MIAIQNKRIRIPRTVTIIQPPDKITYSFGETFDPTGLIVKVVYDDGTESTINDFQWMGEMPIIYNELSLNLTLYDGGTRLSIQIPTTGSSTSMFVWGNSLASTDICTATKNTTTLTGTWETRVISNPEVLVPPEFTQIEFLSNGTGSAPAYIKTNYFHKKTTWLDAIWKWNSCRSYNTVYGAGNGDNTTYCFTWGNNASQVWNIDMDTIGWYNGGIGPSPVFDTETFYHFKLNWNEYYVNDYYKKFSNSTSSSSDCPYEDFIFGRNLKGNYDTGEYGSMSLKSLKIYEGPFNNYTTSALKAHFVPCKTNAAINGYQGSNSIAVAANTAGLYNLVDKRFYVNCATNGWSLGNDLPSTITRSGFSFNGVNQYGTWTLQATNGISIASGEIYIDLHSSHEVRLEYQE